MTCQLGHHALFDDWYANNIFGYLLDTVSDLIYRDIIELLR